jgi:hypothetical protein
LAELCGELNPLAYRRLIMAKVKKSKKEWKMEWKSERDWKRKRERDWKNRCECGDCIFCLFKCPRCGSTYVAVKSRANIDLSLSNDLFPNEINIALLSRFSCADIECRSCGAEVWSRQLGYHISRMCEMPCRIILDFEGVATSYFKEFKCFPLPRNEE